MSSNFDFETEIVSLKAHNEKLKEALVTANQQIDIMSDRLSKRATQNSTPIGRANRVVNNVRQAAEAAFSGFKVNKKEEK